MSLSATTGATNGDLIVKAVSYCSVTPLTQKSIVILVPPPPPPVPEAADINDKCSFSVTAFAKLKNPPVAVQIGIMIDGHQVAYNAADSTFIYFTTQQTSSGYHFITVKYKNTTATMDSSSKTFSYYVTPDVIPALNISGNTTVSAGYSTLLTATPNNGGTLPGYHWQDSTRSHTWQNITGSINKTVSYTPDTTGIKVRCILSSSVTCALPAIVISNSLTFTVKVVTTGINDLIDQSAQVQVYPNPVTTSIVVDSLLAADNWYTVEIVNIYGQKVVQPRFIQNRTQVSIPVMQLNKGLYILILRKKNGILTSRTFIKQ